MLSCWQELIVVTTSVMPSELAKALLEAGAKAVVCCRGDASVDEEAEAMKEFMTAFYQHLLSGRPVVKALIHAGKLLVHYQMKIFKLCCTAELIISSIQLFVLAFLLSAHVSPRAIQAEILNSSDALMTLQDHWRHH